MIIEALWFTGVAIVCFTFIGFLLGRLEGAFLGFVVTFNIAWLCWFVFVAVHFISMYW